MNHIQSLVVSVTARCRRFIAFQVSSLRVKVSTAQINKLSTGLSTGCGKLFRGVRNAGLTSTFKNVLPRFGTLTARAFKGSGRAAKRIARTVAFVIGISLSIPMASADSGSIDAIDPKRYIKLALPKNEAKCLSRLIGKESAWNHKAIGNLNSPTKSYVYGLLQLKNPIVKDKSPIEQIHFGLKYIDHRYFGNSCLAWSHWKEHGWH
jgi:hypothetical protein